MAPQREAASRRLRGCRAIRINRRDDAPACARVLVAACVRPGICGGGRIRGDFQSSVDSSMIASSQSALAFVRPVASDTCPVVRQLGETAPFPSVPIVRVHRSKLRGGEHPDLQTSRTHMCRAAILVGTVMVPAKDWASQPGRKRNEEQATHERCCRCHEKQVFFVSRG